jgi:hypothetical protein
MRLSPAHTTTSAISKPVVDEKPVEASVIKSPILIIIIVSDKGATTVYSHVGLVHYPRIGYFLRNKIFNEPPHVSYPHI